jgi:glycosyltransferase involved in cell wall biosynthesis
MSGPLVSVVMAVHDGERFLAEAIDSVLGQTYPHREIVVVDDGSADGSAAIARSRPVRLQRQPNRGVAAARNAGLAAARGDFIAFLDQDDTWLPHKLEAQVAFLLEHPSADMVVSPVEVALEPGAPPLSWYEPDAGMDVQLVPLLGALLARRSSVDRVGPFDTRYEIASDTDWVMRARDSGLAVETALEVCMRYRIHDGNASRNEALLNDEVRAVYRASVGRKRRARQRSVEAP